MAEEIILSYLVFIKYIFMHTFYGGSDMAFEGMISNDHLLIYNELSKFALDLGYKKKSAKTKDEIYIFLHPKTKERV